MSRAGVSEQPSALARRVTQEPMGSRGEEGGEEGTKLV